MKMFSIVMQTGNQVSTCGESIGEVVAILKNNFIHFRSVSFLCDLDCNFFRLDDPAAIIHLQQFPEVK